MAPGPKEITSLTTNVINMPFNTFYTPLVIWLIPFHLEVSIFVHRCLVWGVLKNIQKYKLVMGDEPLSSCKQDRKLTRFGTALDPWFLWKNHVRRATINQALDIRKNPSNFSNYWFLSAKTENIWGWGLLSAKRWPPLPEIQLSMVDHLLRHRFRDDWLVSGY